jgi:hypothetical protein
MNRAADLDNGFFVMKDVVEEYTRRPRRDLRQPPADQSKAGPQPCEVCKCSPCSESCAAWNNLRAAVLCIGLDEYKHLSPLRNAKRDAYEIQRRVNALLDQAVGRRCWKKDTRVMRRFSQTAFADFSRVMAC